MGPKRRCRERIGALAMARPQGQRTALLGGAAGMGNVRQRDRGGMHPTIPEDSGGYSPSCGFCDSRQKYGAVSFITTAVWRALQALLPLVE